MAAEDGSSAAFIHAHGGPYSLCAWHELQVGGRMRGGCCTVGAVVRAGRSVCQSVHSAAERAAHFRASPAAPPQSTLAAQLPPGVLRTHAAFARYEEDSGSREGVRVEFQGGSHRPVRAALLVGADGAQSSVRQQLLADGPPTFQGARYLRTAVLLCQEKVLLCAPSFSWTSAHATQVQPSGAV